MRVAGPTPNMIRPAPTQPQVAAVCRRRTQASLQSGVRLREAPITHHHNHEVRLLLPQPTVAVRCPPLSAFDSALRSEPASSWPRLAENRTPHGSARSLRTLPPADLLPSGFDAAGAAVLIPYSSPSHSSIRTVQFIGALL